VQPDAAPDHDWNARIARECYLPLARAGAFGWLSFDVGPTLLRWLEREAAEAHEAVTRGDARSVERLGHGNALAQPYHHIILPLASAREKRTEIRWGVADFVRRFGRAPEGMWLPETAVDRDTLESLADAGISFAVLAPHQVEDAPPDGTAGRVTLDRGREIAIFAYDGALSHGVAFGALLADPATWVEALGAGPAERRIVAIATDGETFGHHHPGAERTLAEVVAAIRDASGLRLENFASCLARTGATREVRLVEPSSWSCSHGIERWRDECGCRMAPETPSQQAWRRPLREALDWLAAALDATDMYPADPDPAGLALDRGAMFTSCAWFFDDVGGLEPAQVLAHAAHAIDTVAGRDRPLAERLEAGLLERLAAAPSNDPEIGDAARLYLTRIRAAHPFGEAA